MFLVHRTFYFFITQPPKPDFRRGGLVKPVFFALPVDLASAGG